MTYLQGWRIADGPKARIGGPVPLVVVVATGAPMVFALHGAASAWRYCDAVNGASARALGLRAVARQELATAVLSGFTLVSLAALVGAMAFILRPDARGWRWRSSLLIGAAGNAMLGLLAMVGALLVVPPDDVVLVLGHPVYAIAFLCAAPILFGAALVLAGRSCGWRTPRRWSTAFPPLRSRARTEGKGLASVAWTVSRVVVLGTAALATAVEVVGVGLLALT